MLRGGGAEKSSLFHIVQKNIFLKRWATILSPLGQPRRGGGLSLRPPSVHATVCKQVQMCPLKTSTLFPNKNIMCVLYLFGYKKGLKKILRKFLLLPPAPPVKVNIFPTRCVVMIKSKTIWPRMSLHYVNENRIERISNL